VPDVKKMLEADDFYKRHVPTSVITDLSSLAIEGVFKDQFSGLEASGLVFAGYGDNDYFPRLQSYRVRGLVLGKLFYTSEREIIIDQENQSDFVPFAQSEMIDTFIWGVSIGSMVKMDEIFMKQLENLEQKIKDAGKMPDSEDISPFKQEMKDNFADEILEYFDNSHRRPLRRVIGSLPFNELAELAETLVFIESLKERVLTPDESVSGPIDVAVISKGDGFIWIKRKHYFDPKLNPRFFARRGVMPNQE
jgi:hypothetical protein